MLVPYRMNPFIRSESSTSFYHWINEDTDRHSRDDDQTINRPKPRRKSSRNKSLASIIFSNIASSLGIVQRFFFVFKLTKRSIVDKNIQFVFWIDQKCTGLLLRRIQTYFNVGSLYLHPSRKSSSTLASRKNVFCGEYGCRRTFTKLVSISNPMLIGETPTAG